MIEILLEGERHLAAGRLDEAERLFDQAVTADPRNSIAAVGLARVALERGDERLARERGRQALAIDPENVAARRLVTRIEEVAAARGEPYPAQEEPAAAAANAPTPATGTPSEASEPSRRRGLLGRLLRRG